MRKGTRLYSILKFRCPQCQEGKFLKSHPYNLKKVGEILEKCPNCEMKYEREVGFFYGAMYISYGLGIAAVVTCILLTYIFFPSPSPTTYVINVVVGTFLMGPILYALSKIIWVNLFVKYKKDKSEWVE